MANESLVERTIEERLKLAEDEKSQGNTHFRQQEYDQALFVYRRALEHLPFRPSDAKHQDRADSDDLEADSSGPESSVVPPVEEAEGVAQARSVLHANIAACHVKLGDHQRAVEACSQALQDDPDYIKALQRRASSNEAIATWSSLTSAQEDYTKLLQILPESASQRSDVQRSLRLLKPRLEAAQQKETAEMMEKLKGVGNSFLGKRAAISRVNETGFEQAHLPGYFGLSTDNFKLDPNGQGGYSVNFSR